MLRRREEKKLGNCGRMKRLILILILVGSGLFSYWLWSRSKAGISWDGDVTGLMRGVIAQEVKIQRFTVHVPHTDGSSTPVDCLDWETLQDFGRLEEIKKFGQSPVGRVVPGELFVDSFIVECSIINDGGSIFIKVSAGLISDGVSFKLPKNSKLQSWIRNKIDE